MAKTYQAKVKCFIPRFLENEDLKSVQLEDESDTSRQSMTQIRDGRDVRLTTMLRILGAARRLAKRDVKMGELWHLEPETDDTRD